MSFKRILILYDYFDPAYKAGGPIRSLINLVKLMEDQFELYVLTTNRDHDGSVLDVASNRWVSYGNSSKVQYLSRSSRGYKAIKKIMIELRPNVVYINGLFSVPYVLFPLITLRNSPDRKIVLAPRGMLQKGALQIKKFKKKLYLSLLRLLILKPKGIFWHATDLQEKHDIEVYCRSKNVHIAGNIPSFTQAKLANKNSRFHFVSISLIAIKKNLLEFIKALNNIETYSKVYYHIYGPVKDQAYFEKIQRVSSAVNSNIEITYKGAVHPSSVAKVLRDYRFYVLPTLGENFGHSIFEAFNHGVPVIISNRTPWRDLRRKHAGWDVELEDPNALSNAIKEAIHMSPEAHLKFQQGARQLAERYMAENDFVTSYLKLFS